MTGLKQTTPFEAALCTPEAKAILAEQNAAMDELEFSKMCVPVVRHFERSPVFLGTRNSTSISVDELYCVTLCGPFGRVMP